MMQKYLYSEPITLSDAVSDDFLFIPFYGSQDVNEHSSHEI